MSQAACGVKAIIFDLGNVLIDFDHRIAASSIASFSDKNPEEIYNLFFDSQLTRTFEEGRILPSEFFARVKEMLGLRLDYEQFLPIWNQIFFFTAQNQAVYNLAQSLKARYKIALLSNINILHFEYLEKNFPVFDAFCEIITSFELGLLKPHPLIYQKAWELLGVSAQEVFYTDDRIELVEEARGLGMWAFVYKGPEQLMQNLSDSGIEII